MAEKFAPLGAGIPLDQQRTNPIPDAAKSAHALEHIARQSDAIVELLERLLAAQPPKP